MSSRLCKWIGLVAHSACIPLTLIWRFSHSGRTRLDCAWPLHSRQLARDDTRTAGVDSPCSSLNYVAEIVCAKTSLPLWKPAGRAQRGTHQLALGKTESRGRLAQIALQFDNCKHFERREMDALPRKLPSAAGACPAISACVHRERFEPCRGFDSPSHHFTIYESYKTNYPAHEWNPVAFLLLREREKGIRLPSPQTSFVAHSARSHLRKPHKEKLFE